MEIILKKDMPGLGERNDIVNVKAGYARNYLLPNRFAVIATPSARKELAENMKQQVHKEQEIRKNAQELAKKIETLHLEIKVKNSEKGKLYGSVSNMHVAEAIKKKGFDIDRRRIILPGPVKELGDFIATAKLYRDIVANVNFKIVPTTPLKKVNKKKSATKIKTPGTPTDKGQTEEEMTKETKSKK